MEVLIIFLLAIVLAVVGFALWETRESLRTRKRSFWPSARSSCRAYRTRSRASSSAWTASTRA